MNKVYLVLGWILVGVGCIGLFLPLLPTVPFLLVAAFCFERGSPRVHGWLMDHPRFGPPLRDWNHHQVIRPRAKILAVLMMTLSIGYVVLFKNFFWALKLAAILTGTAVAVFILTRRSKPQNGV